MQYKGWIPTVGERLSFSLAGHTKYPSQAITRSAADPSIRYIISFQRRWLSDTAIPFAKRLLTNALFSHSNDFWFVMVAQVSNCPAELSGPLVGHILFFENKEAWKQVRGKIKKAQENLCSFPGRTNLEAWYEVEVQALLDAVGSLSLVKAEFEVERTGICTITRPPSQPALTDQFRNASAREIFRNENLAHALFSQFFFFLKDLIHVHQHHHPKTDTIVDLYKVGDGKSQFEWMALTLRALYKKVLDFKRENAAGMHSSTVGIVAYVSAFDNIARRSLSSSEYTRLPKRNHESLVASIDASGQKIALSQARRYRVFDSFKTLSLSGAALLLSLAGIARFVEGPGYEKYNGTWPQWLLHKVIEHPVQPLSVLLITILILLLIEGTIPWKESRALKDVLRLVQPLRRRWAIALLLGGSALFAALTWGAVISIG